MSIEVNASAQRVWDVLTLRHYTAEWASEFAPGGPGLNIDSDWALGSPVLWKDPKGHVVVEGIVTAVEPLGLLRFTVVDTSDPRPAAPVEDGIAYKLTERDGRTRLWVSQGDFSTVADGAKHRDLSATVWDRVLIKIKGLAEGGS